MDIFAGCAVEDDPRKKKLKVVALILNKIALEA